MNEKLKYKLVDMLYQLPVHDYKKAMQYLPNALGVTPRTFKGWMFRKIGDQNDIPSEHLIRLAFFFEVQPHELYNFDFCDLVNKSNISTHVRSSK